MHGPQDGGEDRAAADPDDRRRRVLRERARLALHRGEFAAVLEHSQALLADDPEERHALYLHGYAALALGQNERARRTAGELLRLHSEAGEAHQLMGLVLHHGEGDPVRAETHLRAAVRVEPEVPEFHASLGGFLGVRGRLEEGITVVHKGLRHDPANPACLSALQMLYRWNEEPEQAERVGRQALEHDPEDSLHHREAGLRFLEGGRPTEARQRFLEAMRLSPNSAGNKDQIAHEKVSNLRLYREGTWFPARIDLALVAYAVPLLWYALSFLWRPFVALALLSGALVVLLHLHFLSFLLLRWLVRRRIDRGRL